MSIPTVKQVKEVLDKMPDDFVIFAYDGEGGCSINIKPPEENEQIVASIYTNDWYLETHIEVDEKYK